MTAFLSPRQRQVVHLIAGGYPDREIGEILGITENSVNSHLRAAYAKLGVNNREQAIVAAIESGEIKIATAEGPPPVPTDVRLAPDGAIAIHAPERSSVGNTHPWVVVRVGNGHGRFVTQCLRSQDVADWELLWNHRINESMEDKAA